MSKKSRRRSRSPQKKRIAEKRMPRWLSWLLIGLAVAAAVGLLGLVIFNPRPLPTPGGQP